MVVVHTDVSDKMKHNKDFGYLTYLFHALIDKVHGNISFDVIPFANTRTTALRFGIIIIINHRLKKF